MVCRVAEFAWPWVFVLLPLPWLLWRWLPAAQPVEALQLPHAGLRFGGREPLRRPRWRVLLLGLAWLCLLGAAARPQWLGRPQPLHSSGRALLLAVDLSGSMATPDMRFGGRDVSRFAAVEAIAGDFIARRIGDRLGLILFGSQAYLVTPLTYDLSAVRAQLKGAAVGLAGRRTAIGDAVAVAVNTLRRQPVQSRVLVLLTDGVNNAGTLKPRQAERIARAAGVRIYTIGIGGTPLRVQGFFGAQLINPSADLDVDMLTQMAAATGGRFFRADDGRQLAAAYRSIAALEPVPAPGRPLRSRHELFPWPLLAALVLALAAALLRYSALPVGEVAA